MMFYSPTTIYTEVDPRSSSSSRADADHRALAPVLPPALGSRSPQSLSLPWFTCSTRESIIPPDVRNQIISHTAGLAPGYDPVRSIQPLHLHDHGPTPLIGAQVMTTPSILCLSRLSIGSAVLLLLFCYCYSLLIRQNKLKNIPSEKAAGIRFRPCIPSSRSGHYDIIDSRFSFSLPTW